MECLGGCAVKVVTAKNLGLDSGVFCSLPLSLFSSLIQSSSSLSSQCDDIGNSFGHVFPSGVHIAQYLECSVNYIGALGEVEDNMDEVSIGRLVSMGTLAVVVPATSLAFPKVADQFC